MLPPPTMPPTEALEAKTRAEAAIEPVLATWSEPAKAWLYILLHAQGMTLDHAAAILRAAKWT